MEKTFSISNVRWCLLNLLGCIIFLLVYTTVSFASDYCLSRYGNLTKKYSQRYFGIDFPWWYNVGVYKVESNCVWKRSLDGHGSIGIAQITPKWWDDELVRVGLGAYKVDNVSYVEAFVFILRKTFESVTKLCSTSSNTKKLWITYQGYNRSIGKLNREVLRAKECNYEKWREVCNERDVCVWRLSDGTCKQWRNGCDINGSYSLKVYKHGRQIRDYVGYDSDGLWLFW